MQSIAMRVGAFFMKLKKKKKNINCLKLPFLSLNIKKCIPSYWPNMSKCVLVQCPLALWE
jgi:hypothetical protein